MSQKSLKMVGTQDEPISLSAMDEAIPVRERRLARFRTLFVAVGVAATIAVGLWVLLYNSQTSIALESVSVAQAEQGLFRESTSALAAVEPTRRVVLASDTGGQVEQIFLRAGSRVEEGTRVYQLSNPQLELDILQRQAEVTQQVSNLYTIEQNSQQRELELERLIAEAEAAHDEAALRRNRVAALSERGFVSQVEMESAQRDERRTETQLRSVRLNHARFLRDRKAQEGELSSAVQGLRQSLSVAQRSQERLLIRSPIVGVLTEVKMEVGEFADPGQSIGTVADDRSLQLVAQIDQFFLGRVREGQTAEMTVGNTKKPLVVTKVLPNVEAGKFRVELGGSGLSGQIRLGQNVPVRILLSKASQSITIPVGPYLDETGGQFVFVLSPDGSSAERRRVRLGARSDRQIVVEQGLSAGERVIISSYKEFEQYDRVRFH